MTTRRDFLKFTSLAGAGLTLGALLPERAAAAGGSAAATPALAMPFLRVDPDNTVTVTSKHVEAGQGVWTGLPAIVAEELDAYGTLLVRGEHFDRVAPHPELVAREREVVALVLELDEPPEQGEFSWDPSMP